VTQISGLPTNASSPVHCQEDVRPDAIRRNQPAGRYFKEKQMESTAITLAISNIGVALLIIGISIPLVMGKIPMNPVYGIRFRKSYESEETWYRVNRYGGKQLIIWSIPLLGIGLLSFFLPLKGNGLLTTLIACAPLIVLVPACLSYFYAKKL